jgi:hypothetical protein
MFVNKVAKAFVKQYYQTLCYTREDAYKFYNDSSILGRTDSNGKMMNVTTINVSSLQRHDASAINGV